ncbi:MAG: hypothetical protein GY801_38620 [bacterium]|nr:hypothetical protein [bacterium]
MFFTVLILYGVGLMLVFGAIIRWLIYSSHSACVSVFSKAENFVRKQFYQRTEWRVEDILEQSEIPQHLWQEAIMFLDAIADLSGIATGFMRPDDCFLKLFKVFKHNLQDVSDKEWKKAGISYDCVYVFIEDIYNVIFNIHRIRNDTYFSVVLKELEDTNDPVGFIVSKPLKELIMLYLSLTSDWIK